MTASFHTRLALAGAAIFAAMVVLMPAEQAWAQRPGGGQRGGAGGRMGMLNSPGLNQLFLLRNPSVQTELRLTDEQKTKSAALGDKVQQEMQGVFAELGELDPEDREAKLVEVRKMAAERGKAVAGELGAILTAEQTARLKQINLQMRGMGALADPDVAAELKLSNEQTKQLAAIREENDAASRELFREARDSGGDREAIRTKMADLRKSGTDKAMAVLTAEQKAQFEKMQGPKAEIRFEGPGGGQRPLGGGRRGQGA
ncbi:MAG: hypothetical protein JNG90_02705 [Planctomycetaceae bacterium]|nr:hypothetical protein [Planctomycetaceae bacterium]